MFDLKVLHCVCSAVFARFVDVCHLEQCQEESQCLPISGRPFCFVPWQDTIAGALTDSETLRTEDSF